MYKWKWIKMSIKLFVLFNLFIITLCNPVLSTLQLDYGDLNYRLNGLTTPISYDVTLQTYLHVNSYQFDGSVKINLQVRNVTKSIQLNVLPSLTIEDLQIKRTRYPGESFEASIEVDTIETDSDTEILHITTNDALDLDRVYELSIAFTGYLLNGTKGFYYSSYYNSKNNQSRSLASTQMQATYARSAFPCYDEPEYKATFDIHIVHDNSRHAISNMAQKSTEKVGNLIRTTFETTPLMSTYLLAFVVSDFEHSTDGEFIKIFSQPDRNEQTQYALQTSIKTLKAIELFFDIVYDLPKLDLIALPKFQTGAMENWGLVAFRFEYLLHESGVTTLADEENIAATITHEFAHNLFGNLVTPKWWSSLWLSEGFASFYEYYITHVVNSEYRMDEIFVIEILQGVFWRDAFASTFPIYREGETPRQINSIFNGITYSKAACVIRMMNYAIGEPNFLTALKNYITDHRYSNVVSSDLYGHIQIVLDKNSNSNDSPNIEEIFDSWITQSGYPVINVHCNYDQREIIITQNRFFMDANENANDNTQWWIPYNFVSSYVIDFYNPHSFGWIKTSNESIKIPHDEITSSHWIIFNAQQTGYYRVNYDKDNWNLIINHLNSTKFRQIIPLNRVQLIDDSLNLGRAGQLSYETVFNLLEYLAWEDDYIPWLAANTNFAFLFRLQNFETYSLFQRFGRYITTKAFRKIGIEDVQNEPRWHKKLCPIIINLACRFGLEECREATVSVFDQIENGKLQLTDIQIDCSPAIMCGAMRYISNEQYQSIWKQFQNSTSEHERDIYLHGFGCIENIEQITAIVGTLFHSDHLQKVAYLSGEQLKLARRLMSNGIKSASILLDYLNSNFEELKGINYDRLSQLILDLDLYIKTTDELQMYNALLLQIRDNESEDDIIESQKNAERNILWLNENAGLIMSLLDKEYPEVPIEEDLGDEHEAASSQVIISGLIVLSLMFTLY